MSIRMKSFLVLSLFCFACVSDAASDPCKSLSGNWKGIWKSHFVRHNRNITCRFNTTVDITSRLPSLTADFVLGRGQPFLFCPKGDNFVMRGMCKNGKITFTMDLAKGQAFSGVVKGSTITFSNDNAQVELTKQS